MASSRLLAFERYLGMVLKAGLVFFGAILLIKFFIVSPAFVDGPSMEPTYNDNENFIVNRFWYLFVSPKRYDIIHMKSSDNDHYVIKRVIGLPGEVVHIKGGKIYVQPLEEYRKKEPRLVEETYLAESTVTRPHKDISETHYFVQEGEYFVVGDNRPNSIDSRAYGPITRSFILGKVIEI